MTEKLKLFTLVSTAIVFISSGIKFLLEHGFIVYKEKLVSIPLLLPYNNHFLIAEKITAAIAIIYFGYIAYRFFTARSTPDSWTGFAVLSLISFLMLWSVTFEALSEPLPIFDLSIGLLLFIPLSIFVTKLAFVTLKIIFE